MSYSVVAPPDTPRAFGGMTFDIIVGPNKLFLWLLKKYDFSNFLGDHLGMF